MLGFEQALIVIEANSEHNLKVFMMIWKVKGKSSSSLGMRYVSWVSESRFDKRAYATWHILKKSDISEML